MRRLVNRSQNTELARDVREARTFFARLRGLLGRSGLPDGEALWIHRCNSIHSFFMLFAIDAVFVDERLVVRKVVMNMVPWRMTLPARGADSVFELRAGTLTRAPVNVGDQLHVGD